MNTVYGCYLLGRDEPGAGKSLVSMITFRDLNTVLHSLENKPVDRCRYSKGKFEVKSDDCRVDV